jgi:hypothetical protein
MAILPKWGLEHRFWHVLGVHWYLLDCPEPTAMYRALL